MKKYIFVVAILLLFVNIVHATPDASDWYKTDLIGANKTSYFYYLTHQELPGSYHLSYTHYRLIQRNKKTGKIEKNIHLKTTKNIADVQELSGKSVFNYSYKHTFISKANPMEIIRTNNVYALYPAPDAPRNLKFDKKGMYALKGKKRGDILSRQDLDRFIKGYDEWLDGEQGVKVSNVYFDRDYFYYLLEYGEGGDMDYYQVLLPVRSKIIYSLNK